MCLTGVDYFSTLGYQPGIAALAAGGLAPMATLILVVVTLLGALPMYRRVAKESPHGDGSLSMLERLLTYWPSKLLVLSLLGFVATGFVITITLSAADASAHLLENPFLRSTLEGQQVTVTLVLLLGLTAVFLKGFKEAIGLAVVLVGIYLGLSLVVVVRGAVEILGHRDLISRWTEAISIQYATPGAIIIAALIVFPRLALGLSGFETGVVVMPLIKGDASDTHDNPAGRIRGARRLLTTAAIIMSTMLVGSSLVTTILIPAEQFKAGGQANGRALAYVAHSLLGDGLGTAYDISTIGILWFAGASALAGLLNIIPRYLPRYGMAPDWARSTRVLVLVFFVICSTVTLLFGANVDAQAGAYATGVLALMTSAAIAVFLTESRRGHLGGLTRIAGHRAAGAHGDLRRRGAGLPRRASQRTPADADHRQQARRRLGRGIPQQGPRDPRRERLAGPERGGLHRGRRARCIGVRRQCHRGFRRGRTLSSAPGAGAVDRQHPRGGADQDRAPDARAAARLLRMVRASARSEHAPIPTRWRGRRAAVDSRDSAARRAGPHQAPADPRRRLTVCRPLTLDSTNTWCGNLRPDVGFRTTSCSSPQRRLEPK